MMVPFTEMGNSAAGIDIEGKSVSIAHECAIFFMHECLSLGSKDRSELRDVWNHQHETTFSLKQKKVGKRENAYRKERGPG